MQVDQHDGDEEDEENEDDLGRDEALVQLDRIPDEVSLKVVFSSHHHDYLFAVQHNWYIFENIANNFLL